MDANRDANVSLWLAIGFGITVILTAILVLAMLTSSVLRPLASLQRSVQAVMSGNPRSRASVSGPEEVASLARDFNRMISQQEHAAEEMAHRLEVETAVAQTSNLLVAADDIDAGLNAALGILAEAVGANHAFVFTLRDGNTKMDNSHEWCGPRMRSQMHKFQDMDCARFPWLMERLTHNEPIIVPDVSAMPDEAATERETFLAQRVQTVLGVRLGADPKLIGFVGFDDTRGTRAWREEDVRLLQLASESISSFIERKHAELALRESDERYRTLFDRSLDAVYIHDFEGRFLDMNDEALRFLGYSRKEITNLRLTDIIGEAQGPMALALIDKIRRTGRQPGIATFKLRRRDGTHVDVELSAAIVQRDGQPVAIQGVARDVTARRQAEEALRESEERFRTLSASAPVGIFLMDNNGQIVYTNERLRAISGAPAEGGPSAELALAVHPDDREQLLAAWAKAEKERGSLSQEYRILTPAKETRWVSMHVSPIFSADGTRTSVVGSIEDITAQKQAEEEMANRLKMESAITQASNVLAGSDDGDAVLKLVLPILAEAFGVQRAMAFVARGRNRLDGLHEWCAPGIESLEDIRDFDATTLPWIAERMIRGEALIVPDVSALPPEAAAEKNAWEPLGIRSLLAVPLASRGRNIGCVMFSNTKGTRVWREEDVRLLRLASESISSFIERQRAGAEKRKAYESIVLLLATAAEARDPYTENHLHRIRNYSEAIARELGLSPEEAQEIGLAALLHDLGKVRVPDSILRKPGPLSEEEWQVMRKHPIWGEELLPPDPWFKTARQITRWHHENWDGSGYPDGLDTDMIPLAATIVAVADGFDAMTSRRPYKGPWPPIRAMREIMKSRGQRYSPEAVDAFQRAVEKGEIGRIAAVRHAKLSDLTRAA